MRKSRYSDEEIMSALRQAEAGVPIVDIIDNLGVSEATFAAWRKRFGSHGIPEIHELHHLRIENAHLRRLVAHLTLAHQVKHDVINNR